MPVSQFKIYAPDRQGRCGCGEIPPPAASAVITTCRPSVAAGPLALAVALHCNHDPPPCGSCLASALVNPALSRLPRPQPSRRRMPMRLSGSPDDFGRFWIGGRGGLLGGWSRRQPEFRRSESVFGRGSARPLPRGSISLTNPCRNWGDPQCSRIRTSMRDRCFCRA
jgi:hypothetical protein